MKSELLPTNIRKRQESKGQMLRAIHPIRASDIRVLSAVDQGTAVLEPASNTGYDSDEKPSGTDAPAVSSAVGASPTSDGLGVAA